MLNQIDIQDAAAEYVFAVEPVGTIDAFQAGAHWAIRKFSLHAQLKAKWEAFEGDKDEFWDSVVGENPLEEK